jgi:hypothetical protein
MGAMLAPVKFKAAAAIAEATPTGSNGLAAPNQLCNWTFEWHRCSEPNPIRVAKLSEAKKNSALLLA